MTRIIAWLRLRRVRLAIRLAGRLIAAIDRELERAYDDAVGAMRRRGTAP